MTDQEIDLRVKAGDIQAFTESKNHSRYTCTYCKINFPEAGPLAVVSRC